MLKSGLPIQISNSAKMIIAVITPCRIPETKHLTSSFSPYYDHNQTLCLQYNTTQHNTHLRNDKG